MYGGSVGLLGLRRLHPLHCEQKHLLGDRDREVNSEGETESKEWGRERERERKRERARC